MSGLKCMLGAPGGLAMLALSLLVAAVCWRVLPEMGFRGIARAALALCVALLSTLALANLNADAELAPESEQGSAIDMLLVPYAALALSILSALVAMMVVWCRQNAERGRDCHRCRNSQRESIHRD